MVRWVVLHPNDSRAFCGKSEESAWLFAEQRMHSPEAELRAAGWRAVRVEVEE